jgi:hypothetical protein
MPTPCRGRSCFSVVEDNSPLCIDCWAYRVVVRTDLLRLWTTIPSALTPSANRTSMPINSSAPGSRAPLREALLYQQERALSAVVFWAMRVREIRSMNRTLSPLGRADFKFRLALDTLDRHDEVLVTEPDVAHYYNGLYDARRALSLLIDGAVRETEHIDGSCPSCASATLTFREHRNYTLCLTCGGRWGQATWHSFRSSGLTA